MSGSVSARVTAGRQEAAGFMAVPWVKNGLTHVLGVEPFPGTLNLVAEDPAALATLRQRPGTLLRAQEDGICDATLWPVTISNGEGQVPGLVLVPHVPGYPSDAIEVVAAVHVRSALHLSDGDTVLVFTNS